MSDGSNGTRDTSDGWPVELRGVTESLVTTLGPNDRWNVAALGLHASEGPALKDDAPKDGAPKHRSPTREDTTSVIARTWGRTRTRLNLEKHEEGYVQFTQDPVLFVDATLSVTERDEPVIDGAFAVVEAEVERIDEGTENGTEWVDWALHPADFDVYERSVPTTNRGYNAVVEATVAASRLDVPAYDTEDLLDRLRYFESVVDACGGDLECEAFDRLTELVEGDW